MLDATRYTSVAVADGRPTAVQAATREREDRQERVERRLQKQHRDRVEALGVPYATQLSFEDAKAADRQVDNNYRLMRACRKRLRYVIREAQEQGLKAKARVQFVVGLITRPHSPYRIQENDVLLFVRAAVIHPRHWWHKQVRNMVEG